MPCAMSRTLRISVVPRFTTRSWSDSAPVAYPDEEGKSLTDGVSDPGDSDYLNPAWAGFNKLCPDYSTNGGYAFVTVDLGAKTDITGAKAYAGTSALGQGIGCANFTVEVLVSDDGSNWTSVGLATFTDDPSVNVAEVEIAGSASGQYVQFRFMREGWMFVSEVEVYA